MTLAEDIKESHTDIKSIKITGVGLTDSNLKLILDALSLRNQVAIAILDFRNNNLTDESVAVFRDISAKVDKLYLQDNLFTDEALFFKGDILVQKLGSVNLNYNYIQTPEAVTRFKYFSDHFFCRHQNPLVGVCPMNCVNSKIGI